MRNCFCELTDSEYDLFLNDNQQCNVMIFFWKFQNVVIFNVFEAEWPFQRKKAP